MINGYGCFSDYMRAVGYGPGKDTIRGEVLMMQEFDIVTVPILQAVIIVMAAIVLNALLGMLKAAKEGDFDIRKMPAFLAEHILPYGGGLLLAGWTAHMLPEPYALIFYPMAAMALAKYAADIKDKLGVLFGYNK